jgi:hypothetical protein
MSPKSRAQRSQAKHRAAHELQVLRQQRRKRRLGKQLRLPIDKVELRCEAERLVADYEERKRLSDETQRSPSSFLLSSGA